jgi:hypothetical protein
VPDPGIIHANGWRQGKIVRHDDNQKIAELFGEGFSENIRFIIVSQNCDLVHESYENEPNAEIVLVKPVEGAVNGNYTHGKHPRYLQISLNDMNGDSKNYQCHAASRKMIPRETLETIIPSDDIILSEHELQVLKQWLASRYNRYAFPDSFNNRVYDARRKIERTLKSTGKKIVAVYLSLMPWDEVPEGTSYQLVIYATMLANDFAHEESKQKVNGSIDMIATEINACEGIDVIDHGVKSEDEVTLTDLRMLKKWNYDYFSFREKPGGEFSPDQ